LPASSARCEARSQPLVIQKYAGLISLARSSAPCGICSDSLTKKSMSSRVDDANSTSLIGPAISRSRSIGAVVKVSTRRAGSGALLGPKPTTPSIQPGLG